ncbi:uncharacterized protein BYT42DRAFT_585332 [Radiomyces spectabilis]|uniref:uncharacterized protein n=1 Tax=Radiomyces spectabilis TaxID=64574 RepID=UPI00221EC4EC|nr:uncharacterized protein BYT42DRAFT_585332 [Radiomyces spectabilis]KAI8368115.1 hypothetical protein BYT42DRAFT_585332 [Radiomyces spectabilis]
MPTRAIKDSLFVGHATLMTFVWLVAVPLGVAVAMFGRQHNWPWWPKAHMFIMITMVILPLTAAAICGFTSAGTIKVKPHSLTGTVLVLLAFCQILLGLGNHALFRYRQKRNTVPKHRPWHNTVHIWLGRLVLTLAVINMPLGMRIKRAGLGLYIGYAVVVLFWAIVFLGLVWTSTRKKVLKATENEKPPIQHEATLKEQPTEPK